jgi:hypothetical protein
MSPWNGQQNIWRKRGVGVFIVLCIKGTMYCNVDLDGNATFGSWQIATILCTMHIPNVVYDTYICSRDLEL